MANDNALLKTALEAGVLSNMMGLQSRGGPDESDYALVAKHKAYCSEALQFKEPGQTGEAIRQLAEVLAVLAFQPGGVTFAGLHFEAGAKEQQGDEPL